MMNGNGAASPRTSLPLRGLFLDGVWRCNCKARPPAVKLQTKNHGINHGRWFYTCQRPQQHRCNFFLWASDAEAREKLTILSNSRTEPQNTPQTPTKNLQPGGTGLLTPQTDHSARSAPESRSTSFQSPSKSAKARMMAEDSYEFERDDIITDGTITGHDKPRQPDFGQAVGGSGSTPRKTPRTDSFSSPGKRKLSEMEGAPNLTPTSVFSSRSAAYRFPPASAEISMTPTPSKYRDSPSADSAADTSELSLQALRILETHAAVVPRKAQEELIEFLNRHELKTRGIIRGRDISRTIIKKKDEEIMKLNERIAALESQGELGKSANNNVRNQ